ncbi:hypothetical protein KAJ27_15870, partial [bacterium]|nr:hypothetical protein [bacterium]
MNDFLKTIQRTDDASLYEIITPEKNTPHLRRLVVSTSQTRELCNNPLISGQEYKELLTDAIGTVLNLEPLKNEILGVDPHGLIVLYILSGGLSFDIQKPLHDLGRKCTITMQSEQRLRKPDGRWEIYKNSYAKKHVPKYNKAITVLAGDVCASGKSLSYGLGFQIAQFISNDLKDEILGDLYRTPDGTLSSNERITKIFDNACDPANPDREKVRDALLERIQNVKNENPELFKEKLPFSNFYFFTIGGHRAEIVLMNYVELLKPLFPESLENLNVIYFEDRFDCIHKKNDEFNESGTIHFGTDLLKRKNHLPAPEYEESVFKKLQHLVHRCSIYDCGSRRFDWHFHIADLLHYFSTIAMLGKNGFSAVDLISEKYFLHHMDNEAAYIERRNKIWPDIKTDHIKKIYTVINKTLTECDLNSGDSLNKLAISHIITILETANYNNSFENIEHLKQFTTDL